MNELSHRVNEKLLHIFEKDELVEKLIHCVMSLVMEPRFELMSVLSVLGEYMIKNNETDKKKIKDTLKQAELWLFSGDNKQFNKLWATSTVPDKIQEIYKNAFIFDIDTLIKKNISDMNIFSKKIEKQRTNYLRLWLQPQTETAVITDKTSNVSNFYDEENPRNVQEYIGGSTFKEREEAIAAELAGSKPLTLAGKKIKKTHENVDLRYLENNQEKQSDYIRFIKIFTSFEIKTGDIISKDTRDIITELWYGDFYSKDSDSDNILNIVKKYELHFKISNNRINSEVNRLILQTYIVGLYLGSNILDIYTVINDVLEQNPTMSTVSHNILPETIHNGNVPNLQIQEILNPIINNLPMHKDQIIRSNWNKIRFPNIDISSLVRYLKNINMDSTLLYKINVEIEELSENVVNKNLTIDKFAQEVYKILKSQSMKIPITEKEIIKLLKYE